MRCSPCCAAVDARRRCTGRWNTGVLVCTAGVAGAAASRPWRLRPGGRGGGSARAAGPAARPRCGGRRPVRRARRCSPAGHLLLRLAAPAAGARVHADAGCLVLPPARGGVGARCRRRLGRAAAAGRRPCWCSALAMLCATGLLLLAAARHRGPSVAVRDQPAAGTAGQRPGSRPRVRRADRDGDARAARGAPTGARRAACTTPHSRSAAPSASRCWRPPLPHGCSRWWLTARRWCAPSRRDVTSRWWWRPGCCSTGVAVELADAARGRPRDALDGDGPDDGLG